MKDIVKLVSIVAAFVAIVRILDGGRACVCFGPLCACGGKRS